MSEPVGRVVVTGACGKLGRVVVTELLDHGWHVLAADRVPPPGQTLRGGTRSAEFASVDLADYGQVLELIGGTIDEHGGRVDALVHLAAIPAPGITTNSATFANNTTATWNVFNAARAHAVRNVVWASSETLLGLPFDTPPPYAPIDELYTAPETTYSLVKALEEEMARHLCRWDPQLKMIGLRFSNVMEPHDYERFASFDTDAHLRKWNMWGYIDARDGAQAVRLALAYQPTGLDVFVIANADTVMSRPSAELMAEVFPGVELRKELGEHETLLSIDKARRLLGYEPVHSWRT